MSKCARIRSELTAWVDGELTARRDERVQRHLARCVACAAEAESVRATIQGQRRALSRLTAVPDLDTGPMWAAVQRGLAAADQPGAQATRPAWVRWRGELRGWQWLWRPVAVVGAATAVAVVVTVTMFGGPQKVLVPLGVEAPPPAVSRAPELFKDYPLIQHLDALENFDTVNAEPLDDGQASDHG